MVPFNLYKHCFSLIYHQQICFNSGLEECENISMTNNAGSITEEGPHLSDWEDTSSSVHTEDKEDEVRKNCATSSKYHPVESSFSDDGLQTKLKTPVHPTTTCKVSSHAAIDSRRSLGVIDSNKENVSNINSHNSQNKSEDGSAAPSKSIYIDDGTDRVDKPMCKVKTMPKRLTMVNLNVSDVAFT